MNATANPAGTDRFLDEARSLACIHCGLCLSSCPTYLETGNENDSPRGRIYQMRAVSEGRLDLDSGTVRHFDLCLGCRACEAACPSGVQYGALLEQTREHVEQRHSRGLIDTLIRRVMVEKIFPSRRATRLALAPAGWIKRTGLDRWLPGSLRRFTDLVPRRLDPARPLPAVSPASTRTRLGRVGFVSGCVMDVMFNRTNWNSIRLLNAAGYDVVTPAGQTCCGALHAHSGKLDLARAKARANLEVFAAADVDQIVINAAGCGSTLKEYDHLLHDDPGWRDRARRFSGQVLDLTEALVESPLFLARLRDLQPHRTEGPTVTYHDACHLAHAQRVKAAPRQLLQTALGPRFVELPESDVCCGSAGSYNLTEPEMAARLQQRKLANLLSTGAATVVTTNPGCILQLVAGVENRGANIQVEHLADSLAAWLQLNPRSEVSPPVAG
jgi:glycolate oxidase iron-sulfur subunit